MGPGCFASGIPFLHTIGTPMTELAGARWWDTRSSTM